MTRESWDDKMLRLVSHLGLMGTRTLTTGCLVTSTSCFMLQYWCFSKALNNRSITSFLSMLVYWAPTFLLSSRCSRNRSRQNQDNFFPLFSLQLVQILLLMSIVERFFLHGMDVWTQVCSWWWDFVSATFWLFWGIFSFLTCCNIGEKWVYKFIAKIIQPIMKQFQNGM